MAPEYPFAIEDNLLVPGSWDVFQDVASIATPAVVTTVEFLGEIHRPSLETEPGESETVNIAGWAHFASQLHRNAAGTIGVGEKSDQLFCFHYFKPASHWTSLIVRRDRVLFIKKLSTSLSWIMLDVKYTFREFLLRKHKSGVNSHSKKIPSP